MLQIKICYSNTVYQYIDAFVIKLGLSDKRIKKLVVDVFSNIPIVLFYSKTYFIELVIALNKHYNWICLVFFFTVFVSCFVFLYFCFSWLFPDKNVSFLVPVLFDFLVSLNVMSDMFLLFHL